MADPVLNLTFTWTKDDEPWCDIKPEKNNLKQIVNVSKDKKSSRLKIDGSKLSEDDLEVFKGRYTCTVDDGIGSATANTYVHIAESEGLSTGAIVGIVLGSILGVVIIAGILAYFVYHRNTSSNSYGMTVGAYKNPAYSS